MVNINKKAFTLVELIVVITILAILWTISFISFNSYTKSSRDTNRKTNLLNIHKVLTLEDIKDWAFPVPDNYKVIYFDWIPIIKSWIIWDNVRNKLQISNSIKDPKYNIDYSYSITEDRQSYQIWSILEEWWYDLSWFVGKTYADNNTYYWTRTNIIWSYNWQYLKVFSWWEYSVVTIPSITVNNNTWSVNIKVNEKNTYFSINWSKSIPNTYWDTNTSNKVDFTPRLLFKWPKCWVETDQEIVNFIASLHDSYNIAPYNSIDSYKQVFDDYNYLKNNMVDFWVLEILWRKINNNIWCSIKNFKTTDIFPIACWVENWLFEMMDDNFDMTNSCLYKYNSYSNWSGVVKNWIWKLWSKWLNIYTSVPGYKSQDFNYRFFSYIPFKFTFDYKAKFYNTWSNWWIKFYVDNVEVASFDKNTSWISSFQTYETQLMWPWVKELKWVVYGGYYWDTELILDNLQFWCTSWESNCAWADYTLDPGEELPWNIFTFSWDAWNIIWKQTPDSSEWTHAIISPNFINNYSSNYLTKKINFWTPQKLSFDYKSIIPNDWFVEFYIDWVRYLYADVSTPWISTYHTYTTPLLAAWNHEFKWRVYSWYYKTIKFYLDNIQLLCSWWGWTCWRTDLSFENGPSNPWDIFTFSWNAWSTPWDQTTDSSVWTYAITSANFVNNYSSNYITKNITLASSNKLSFDYKSIIPNDWFVEFYIDWVRYLYADVSTPWISTYHTYTTPLLAAWNHEFKWRVYSWYYKTIKFYLDNIQLLCSWWGWTCWRTDLSFENGPSNPWDIFTFSWDAWVTPWDQTTDSSVWTYAITSTNFVNNYSSNYLTKNINFWTPQKLSFDYKSIIPNDWFVEFYIDWVRYLYADVSTPWISTYHTYTTPLLAAWNHEFKWRVYSWYYKTIKFYLDNIQLLCSWWGWTCWRTDLSFENGPSNPWSLFTFSWNSWSVPWDQTADSSAWTYAITSANFINNYSSNYLTKNITLASPKKVLFDYKWIIPNDGFVEFYIDWIKYLTADASTPWISTYHTYTTPILPAWNYNLIWRVYSWYYKNIKINLDNIQITN